jgi:hypothetical protein
MKNTGLIHLWMKTCPQMFSTGLSWRRAFARLPIQWYRCRAGPRPCSLPISRLKARTRSSSSFNIIYPYVVVQF